MGCDEAVLISDRKFGGSDTWATSYTIAQAIKKIGNFDLIIAGERATDGDTAQVGPGIASWLDLPLATYVAKMETTSNGSGIIVERLVEEGYQKLSIPLPALITVVKEIAAPRLPTLRGKKYAKQLEIPVYNADNMELDASKLGLKGSPTKVVKIDTPKVTRGGKTVIAGRRRGCRKCGGSAVRLFRREGSGMSFVWTIAEQYKGELKQVSFELLSRGRKLADKLDTKLASVVIGDRVSEDRMRELIERGADEVYSIQDPQLADFVCETYCRIMTQLIKTHQPSIILAAATSSGRS